MILRSASGANHRRLLRWESSSRSGRVDEEIAKRVPPGKFFLAEVGDRRKPKSKRLF